MGGTAHVPAVSTADWRAKSFDVLSDATKQLITIATGIIAATVIFSKDLTFPARMAALASWIVLTFSVACGCLVLFHISGQLRRAADDSNVVPTIAVEGIRKSSIWQVCAFVAGLLLLFVFGFLALKSPDTSKETKVITVNCHVDAPPAATPIPCKPIASTPAPSARNHPHKGR
jgi:hypothetical protein